MWNVSNGALILTLDSSDSNAVKLPLPLDPTGNTTNNITDWIAENVGPDTTVYVDMDTTLADFNKKLASLFSVSNTRDITSPSVIQYNAIFNAMPGFFLNLEKLPQADSLLSKFNKYTILTTNTGALNGNGEKQDWASANLTAYPPTGDILFASGEVLSGVYQNANKGEFATPTSVLIDDSPTYVRQFNDAGGNAFRYIWSEVIEGTLPAGLTLTDNTIVGTPISQRTTSTSTFTIRLHDNLGYTDRQLSIKVLADPNFTVWNVTTPYDLGRYLEKTNTNIPLPINQTSNPSVTLISGSLPKGMRLEGYFLKGAPFEVKRLETFKFVLRAIENNEIADRTFEITIEGEDAPVWQTPAGPLNIGSTFTQSLWLDQLNSQYGIYSTINYVTYTVTVDAGTNQYGAGNKYFISGIDGTSPVLELNEGSTYTFDMSSSTTATHGLRFSTTPNGTWGGGVEYTKGVTVVGTAGDPGAYVQIVVPRGAPTLYYYCINHSGMGNTANTPVANTYTKQTVSIATGIPSNSTGKNGDYIFDSENNVFYFKYNDLWKLLNQSELQRSYGNNTRLETSATVPNPLTVEFWFNLNPLNNGLNLKILRFDNEILTWKPNIYNLSINAPVDPEDKNIWIQYFENDARLIFRQYDVDELQWIALPYIASNTPPTRSSQAFFVIDNSRVDFQLQAIDSDLTAGDSLKFYVAQGDGELPPGLTLSNTGEISGFVDPILALDADNYDPYGDSTRLQQGVTDTEGFASDPYDTQFYGYGLPSRNPRKLNRTYDFIVTVADDVSESKRAFSIYVVSSDFLRADNTILRSATGLFTADVTYLRRPIWLTQGDLGNVRADNYTTILIEVFDPNYILGTVNYSLRSYNDDGTESTLPEGLSLDTTTGEIAGVIPYQPAVEKEYKFTIEATRSDQDQEVFTINTNIYEDTPAGADQLKVTKLSRDMTDGVDDVKALIDTQVNIENNEYLITGINEDNDLYDILEFGYPLLPSNTYKPLTIKQPIAVGQAVAFGYRNNLTQQQVDKWVGRNIRFSNTNNVVQQISFLNNYRFEGPSNQDIGINHTAANIAIIPGEPIQTTVKRALNSVTGIATDLIIVDAGDLTSIGVTLPQTALSNNRNILESVFDAEDSSSVDSIVEDDTIKIEFVNPWSVGVAENTQFAIGAVKDKSISKRLTLALSEFTTTSKTFTLSVLGNVESTIAWVTPAILPSLGANRVSYLKVVATSTLVGANLRYDIVSGKVPQGLELKRDGEITGKVAQFGTSTEPGLTTLDNRTTTFDGLTTSFDREYTFKVIARDRFGYSAVTRTFTLSVNDTDNKLYSNIYMQPFLKENERTVYEDFINDYTIFTPALIYRPFDSNFGLQKNLRTLAFAGIEQKSLGDFATAVRQNHGKKKFLFGDIKTAVAKTPGTNDVIYEVVYVDVIDPGKPSKGDTQSRTKIRTGTNLKVNQVKIEVKDDDTAKNQGIGFFSILTRLGTIVKVEESTEGLEIIKQDGTKVSVFTNGSLGIISRAGIITVLTTALTTDNSGDPFRFRPNRDPITVDQTAVLSSQTKDQYRYPANIGTMRKRIKAIGANEREFLPLWMRTAQEGSLSEIDYVTALPLCYTKPGGSITIKENIENAKFDFSIINYEIDRYIIDKTSDTTDETYVLFPNLPYNVV